MNTPPRFTPFGELPRAWGAPLGAGTLKSQPDDFLVREWLGFEPDRVGDHLLLRVRKRGANTGWVAQELARRAGVHPRDVGYCGIKDRHAETEQWFSLPSKADPDSWRGATGDGYEIVAAARHRRKLKRGTHKGNEFVITVRHLRADPAVLNGRLQTIAAAGVPNYFGAQRFGRDAGNLEVARRWFIGGSEPHDRHLRSFALSAARSAIFNEVLAARVRDGTWNRLQAGDVANLDGSGSVFKVAALDAVLEERCSRLDIHPTGPLWGRGEPLVRGAPHEFEKDIVAPWERYAAGLEAQGLEQERRALRTPVQQLRWSYEESVLRLEFRLYRGVFATAVVAAILDAQQELDAGED